MLPEEFTLSQNYPNPFNLVTHFKFSIPNHSFVSIKIFDILGSKVATLIDEVKPAGIYELAFNASHLASVVYFCKMQTYAAKRGAVNFSDTKKIILIK